MAELRRAVRPAVERGGAAVLVVPGDARRSVRAALMHQIPGLQVFAEEEVADENRLELFATVGNAACAAA